MDVQAAIEKLEQRGFLITIDGRTDIRGASAVLGLAEKTIRNMRYAGRGPPSIKLNGMVTYRVSRLLEYVELGNSEPLQATADDCTNETARGK